MSDAHEKKTGRPTKRTPELIASILARVADGWPVGRAAEREGVAARTIRSWQAEDPDLSAALKAAEAETAGICWGALLQMVRNGDREACRYFIDKRFTDPPEVDEAEQRARAERFYQMWQEMVGGVPPPEPAS